MSDQPPNSPAQRPAPPPPPRRRYSERIKRRVKDVQSDQRLRTIGPLIIGTGIGFIWGPFVGINPLIFGPMVGLGVLGLTKFALFLGGKMVSEGIYGASGVTTPRKKDYSRPESLAIRGLYDQAILAYETVLSETREDPEPYIRIARIHRDSLGQLEEAVSWFRRARRDAKLDTARELAVSQELVDIYLHRSNEPRKAIPELARMRDKFPGTQAAQWAEEKLGEIRRQMREEEA
ncbi:MAG: tetratricopeptide repeat protein [Gemmatimonadales bacterium]